MSLHSCTRLLAVVALAGAVSLPAPGAEAPLTVFILAGQSNMKGQGHTAELPAEFARDNPEVQIASYPAPAFQALGPRSLGATFGPEVVFGTEMARALKRPVGLIKLSVGGTSLEQHWNPVASNAATHTGELYHRLLSYVRTVREKNPQIRIAGMIWMQGEADSRYHAKTAAQYRGKLEALIDGCRAQFGVTNLPFVCGRIHPPEKWPYVKQVREAQETLARPNYAWFSCDDLAMHPDDLHYDTAGQIELGKRFAAGMLKLMPPEAEKK